MMNENVIASKPYYFDFLTWTVQKAKPISLQRAVFRICPDPIVFLIFAAHGIAITFIAYIFQVFEPNPKWDLYKLSVNGFACYMGFSCTYTPTQLPSRIGAVAVYFGSNLHAILLSTMTVYCMTTPIYDPQISTIDQIIKSDYKFVGSAFAYELIEQQNQVKYISL